MLYIKGGRSGTLTCQVAVVISVPVSPGRGRRTPLISPSARLSLAKMTRDWGGTQREAGGRQGEAETVTVHAQRFQEDLSPCRTPAAGSDVYAVHQR